MPATWWFDSWEEQIRDAVHADRPGDVLAARFAFVPPDTREAFMVAYAAREDERDLTIRRFAEAVEAYWNEERDQRDRVRDRLRRIWRSLR